MLRRNVLAALSMCIAASLQLAFMRYVLEAGGVELLGKYTYLVGIITPIVVFCNFGIRNIVSTQNPLGIYEQEILAVKLLGYCISISLIVCFFFYIDNINQSLFFLVAGYKLIESFSDLAIANYLYKKDMGKYLLSSGIKFFSVVGIMILSLFIGMTFEKTVFLILLVFFFSAIVDFFEVKKFANKLKLSRKAIKQGFMLGGSSVIASLTVAFPRAFLGEKEEFIILAELGVLLFIVTIMNLLWNSYLQLNLSKLSEKFFSGKRKLAFFLESYVKPVLFIAVIIIILANSIGNFVIKGVFGEEIREFNSAELNIVALVAITSLLQAASNNLFVATGMLKKLAVVNFLFLLLLVVCVLFFYTGGLVSILIIISIINLTNFIFNIAVGFKSNVF